MSAYLCMCVHICAFLCVVLVLCFSLHVCVYICAYVCTCVYICACLCVCKCVSVFLLVCVHVHVRVHVRSTNFQRERKREQESVCVCSISPLANPCQHIPTNNYSQTSVCNPQTHKFMLWKRVMHACSYLPFCTHHAYSFHRFFCICCLSHFSLSLLLSLTWCLYMCVWVCMCVSECSQEGEKGKKRVLECVFCVSLKVHSNVFE
jgi:hypothetical protein